MDYFALLQVPRRPWLDAASLKEHFLKLAAQCHPDKIHAGADESQKAAANANYAELNAAFRCLSEPKDRLLHLIELESGAKPPDVQNIPPGAMDLLMEIGQACRETDQFLTARDKATSPLLKAQLFEKGIGWTDKLNQLRQKVEMRREELVAELQRITDAWKPPFPLERLEQIYRTFSYVARWSGQIQERLVRLSF